MKRSDELSHNEYNSNYSFKGSSEDKPLNELLLKSIISDIDQNDFQKVNPVELSQGLKRDLIFSSQYDHLNSNLAPNQFNNQCNDSQFKFITSSRTKFKSDNQLQNNRMPIMNDFAQPSFNPQRNSQYPNYNSNLNNFGGNYNSNFQGGFNNYPQQSNQNVPSFYNNQPIGKNMMYGNNIGQSVPNYMMGNPLTMNNMGNVNNIANLNNMGNMGNMGNVGSIGNPQFNFNNNFGNFQNQPNFQSPMQVFDNNNHKLNNLHTNPFNTGNGKLQNNNSKSSMETSPITSTNVSLIEEGLNNFHFNKTQRKFLSANQLSPNKQNFKRKSVIPEEFDKKSTINEEYTDVHEILACLDTKLSDYIRSQKGSRNMQKLLNKITPDELDIILKEIGDSLPELMVDPYSNYFCQKLAQCCSSEQRIFFLRKIQKEFIAISCNKKGTYALQGIIEIINLEDEEQIIRESIENHVIFLCLDNNGTHVIQKLISCVDEDKRNYINNQIIANLLKLVLDANGICIAKSFIAGNFSLDIRKRTLEAIIVNCLEILQNPFGNYVIQEVFEKWGFETCKEIVKVIHQNIISLSMQKYSSNVVEKSIEIADQVLRRKVLKDLLASNKITSLLKNKFGNFVLQKAISFIKLDESLRSDIKDNISKKLSGSNNKDKVKLTTLLEML